MQNVGAVDDVQRLADIVVGDQHADAAQLQPRDQIADIADRDGIDAGQRFVEQHEGRIRRQRPRDLDTPPLAARQAPAPARHADG